MFRIYIILKYSDVNIDEHIDNNISEVLLNLIILYWIKQSGNEHTY